ncbi:MAG: leucine dehydrogenase [Myxococcota bacterium]|jgi:leucine dehydrogenase
MSIFNELAELGHEQLLFCRNDEVGLRAIIGIHSTALGPALGGTRLYPYATEEEAVRDVLRLSRGMTYKAAVAGLDLGGGKAVIIGDPSIKNEALFRAFGRHIESLSGRYITAEDMNTSVQDMSWIRRETQWVTGQEKLVGGSGDPSPVTAWGTYQGIRACLEVVYGSPDVGGRTVAIQGIGSVGFHLAKFLHKAGAKLLYSDVNERRLRSVTEQFGGKVISQDEFYSTECDVLAPCAIGGIINARTIPMLRAPIIAGAANNQLDDEIRDGEALEKAGITYAPDYVINAGGLINVYAELKKLPSELAMSDAGKIFNTVKQVINKARALGITTTAASNKVAEERIESVSKLQRLHLP